jgi:Reverse transcriptase (RNA-dependent DNA polymerase)
VKWIFKKKDEQDGTVRYKSRVVLKGYVMIPGVDYTESFSPVSTDTTVRVTIAVTLYRSKDGWINEAAFLNADLDSDTPIYAEWQEGRVELGFMMEQEREVNCIELTRPMYGGVDGPRLFMKTLKRHVTEEAKMVQSLVDPCLYYWLNEKREVILSAVVDVDNVLLSGTRKTIDRFKTELRKRFNISELGLLKKHLGVRCDWKEEKMVKST